MMLYVILLMSRVWFLPAFSILTYPNNTQPSFPPSQDGKVVFKEVIRYLDPLNPVQAVLEADNLISLMDDNGNKVLSMDEIEHHSDIFISSKIVNFASSLHDEF